jgi:hypothetical protein
MPEHAFFIAPGSSGQASNRAEKVYRVQDGLLPGCLFDRIDNLVARVNDGKGKTVLASNRPQLCPGLSMEETTLIS